MNCVWVGVWLRKLSMEEKMIPYATCLSDSDFTLTKVHGGNAKTKTKRNEKKNNNKTTGMITP